MIMSNSVRMPDARQRTGALNNMLLSGTIVGILDGLAGIIVYHIWFGFTPGKVFKFVASGIYGKAAFAGGPGTIIIGILLHFVIGYACSVIYFYSYPKFRWLDKQPVWAGLTYGLLVFLFMNLLIMPMSAVVEGAFDLRLTIIRIIWHMVCVGLPISLITRNYYQVKTR